MANLVVNRSDLYPVGTSVGAYSRSGSRQHGSKPAGTAFATATVAADGSLTFTTLTAGRRFMLWAEVEGEHRYLLVEGPQSAVTPITTEGQTAPARVTLRERIAQRRALVRAGVGVAAGADLAA